MRGVNRTLTCSRHHSGVSSKNNTCFGDSMGVIFIPDASQWKPKSGFLILVCSYWHLTPFYLIISWKFPFLSYLYPPSKVHIEMNHQRWVYQSWNTYKRMSYPNPAIKHHFNSQWEYLFPKHQFEVFSVSPIILWLLSLAAVIHPPFKPFEILDPV